MALWSKILRRCAPQNDMRGAALCPLVTLSAFPLVILSEAKNLLLRTFCHSERSEESKTFFLQILRSFHSLGMTRVDLSRRNSALQYGFEKAEGLSPLSCIVLPVEEGSRSPSESARLPQAVPPSDLPVVSKCALGRIVIDYHFEIDIM